MLLQQEQDSTAPFPEDANVRISISGLAFCDLKTQISKILFLRHPKHHELRMSIYKRNNRNDAPTMIDEPYEFPLESGVTITSDTEAPPDVFAPVTGNERHLNQLLNLNWLHGRRLFPKMPLGVRQPTLVSLRHFRFYTEKMSGNAKFDLTDSSTGQEVFKNQEIGYSMGGKITCRDGGSTLIAVNGLTPRLLPQRENGESWFYDIVFSNHCVEEDKCRAMMSRQSDFRFYYDVLEDPENPGRKFELSRARGAGGIEPKTLDIGACNVVIDDPPLALPLP